MLPDFSDPFWTDEKLTELANLTHNERTKRQRLARTEQDLVETIKLRQSEAGYVDGQPWMQRTGLDAYMSGAEVTHEGRSWESTVDFNVWEPGVSGWREKTEDGSPAPWRQPTGAHDAYDEGAVVTHEGQTWVSTEGNNVWEPGVYGWEPDKVPALWTPQG